MSVSRSVIVNIIGRDNASGAFLSAGRAAERAANSTDRAILRLKTVSLGMQAVGQKMSKAFTLPIIAGAVVAVREAAKYEKSLTLLQTATGEQAKNLDKIGSGLKKISVDTATSLDQLGQGMYLAEKAGFSFAKGGLTVLTAAAQGAKAENVDLGTAMNALTSIMTSYRLKASQAAVAEDMLIRGAGLAKTTYADFANSLSNVVPLAASLGISFPQVAGAIDTMTQHGETAQRATENLANLIANLAGQNNVASAAMQQLGIDTIGLQKNLGKRGLTGTMDVVLDALKKHGKDGMVVYDTFRKAALGTSSLNTMLGKMGGTLKVNSKAFLDGRMGIMDYQKYARSLGGQQGVMGLNFLAAVKALLGFNQLIKSGRGSQQTYAKALQTTLGGVTGLKTMLMLLGGEWENNANAGGQFKTAVAKVASAAKTGGTDVLGFGETSKTAAFKFDQFKTKLMVMATDIGVKIMPFVMQLVGGIEKIVTWIGNLSSTQRKFVGWGLVVLATLGPVMATFGRLGRLIGGALSIGVYVTRFIKGLALANVGLQTYNTRAFQAGVGVRSSFLSAQGGVKMLGGALAGLATGVSWGLITRNASTTTKTVGLIGSTLVGAASGAAVGGLPGGIIGGVIGGLSYLGTAFLGIGSKAKAGMDLAVLATAQLKQTTDDLLNTLKSVNGQYDANYKQQVINNLMQGKDDYGHGVDVLARARQVGFDQQKVVQAALGDSTQRAAFIEQLYNKGVTGGALSKDPDKAQKIFNSVTEALEKVSQGASDAEQHVEDYNRASGLSAVVGNAHANSMKSLSGQFKGFSTEVSKSAGVYKTALTDASFFADSAFGQRNKQLIIEHAQAIGIDAQKMLAQGKSAKTVAAFVESNVGSLHDNLVALHFNDKAVTGLIATYTKLPHRVITELIKKGVLPSDIQAILDKLGLIPGRKDIYLNWDDENARQRAADMAAYISSLTATIRVSTVTGSKMSDPRLNDGAKTPHATGGPVRDGYFTVGERGWELGYKQGNKVTIFDNNQSQKMTGWSHVPGFASGSSDSKKKSTATPKVKYDASKVSTAIGNIGQTHSSPIDLLNQANLTTVSGEIASAIAVLSKQVDLGLKKSTAEAFARQIKRLAAVVEQQLSSIRLRINKSDLTAISNGLKSSVDAGKTAYESLFADLKAAGASAGTLAKFRTNESAALANDQKLLDATAYRTTITDTLRGNFDQSQYGSVQDLLYGLSGATGTNNSYAQELNSLRGRAKGNSTLTNYINQLATSGQTTTLQTLFGASSSDLSSVTRAVAGYNSSVNAGGNAAATIKYGQSVDQLTTAQGNLATSLAELAHAYLKNSAKPTEIKLHVNGKEIAADIVHSKEFDKELAALLKAVVNHTTYKTHK